MWCHLLSRGGIQRLASSKVIFLALFQFCCDSYCFIIIMDFVLISISMMICLQASADLLSLNGFKAVTDTDAVGAFATSRAAFKALKTSGSGVIINMSAILHYGASWWQVWSTPYLMSCSKCCRNFTEPSCASAPMKPMSMLASKFSLQVTRHDMTCAYISGEHELVAATSSCECLKHVTIKSLITWEWDYYRLMQVRQKQQWTHSREA